MFVGEVRSVRETRKRKRRGREEEEEGGGEEERKGGLVGVAEKMGGV
jgi:hypothetical protein